MEKAMQALCLMYKLDKQTCLKHGGSRDSGGSQRNNEKASKVQMLNDMQMYPDRFVKKGSFWTMNKKNQKLQKII